MELFPQLVPVQAAAPGARAAPPHTLYKRGGELKGACIDVKCQEVEIAVSVLLRVLECLLIKLCATPGGHFGPILWYFSD